ncbi:MAG: leucyl aminopeptidase [Nitrospinae bacterium CG11_big_fil_rev_8_21_14_0_20_56_8]|nr:MAG: leucyl aminopeptidase [Nitrospinae bacterium CG11_big_fil_rev_8_21_14_0_20_56_8]
MIKTTVRDDDPIHHSTDCLVLFCLEEKKPAGLLKELDGRLKGTISSAFENKVFEGKPNQTFWVNTLGALGAKHLLLTGLGKAREMNGEKIRQAAGTAAKLAEKSKSKTLSFAVREGALARIKHPCPGETEPDPACPVAEGSYLALYRFDHYKSKSAEGEENADVRSVESIVLLVARAQHRAVERAAERAAKIASAVVTARDLISHPSNTATPTYLADTARAIAKKHKIACKILDRKEMEKLGMGALLGVARGSHEPPAFIVLEYFGAGKTQPPVVIVGKGITFDTGGISLKPPANMDEMKMDMSGGAATLGTLQAVASLKVKANVVGIVPATENMPGGSAIKPGDILKSMSGKTIEVLNTDAEGRLVLADALAYAARYKPKAIIDLATLTGACIVALGHLAAAVIGSDEKLIRKLSDSAGITGERIWELPLWPEHEKAIKSDIADLKNISGPAFGAGTITGAAFLKAFAGDFPWAHLDIAGTAWTGEAGPYQAKGATGFGVRLLLHYIESGAGRKKS